MQLSAGSATRAATKNRSSSPLQGLRLSSYGQSPPARARRGAAQQMSVPNNQVRLYHRAAPSQPLSAATIIRRTVPPVACGFRAVCAEAACTVSSDVECGRVHDGRAGRGGPAACVSRSHDERVSIDRGETHNRLRGFRSRTSLSLSVAAGACEDRAFRRGGLTGLGDQRDAGQDGCQTLTAVADGWTPATGKRQAFFARLGALLLSGCFPIFSSVCRLPGQRSVSQPASDRTFSSAGALSLLS